MLILISPAKKLDFTTPLPTGQQTQPQLIEEAEQLAAIMKKKDVAELAELMKLSAPLAELNMQRYQTWQTPFTPDNARQALFAFSGDVYQGLASYTLNQEQIAFAQQHLRILSGLYGLLRPLDLIQPYRLEMGTRLKTEKGSNLYHFWGDLITQTITESMQAQGDNTVINLASNEYFKSVQARKLPATIITPVFKELRQGRYRIISFHAKRARGMLCRYIIDHAIHDPEALKGFDLDRYSYNASLSQPSEFVFTR